MCLESTMDVAAIRAYGLGLLRPRKHGPTVDPDTCKRDGRTGVPEAGVVGRAVVFWSM